MVSKLSHIKALRCRERARKEFPPIKIYACQYCFGPLEVVYDLDSVELDRETFKNRPRTVWRYHKLLPISVSTKRVGLGTCYAILHRCDRLAEAYRTLARAPQKVSLTHPTENVRYASALTYGKIIQKHGTVGACLCCAGSSLAALLDSRKHSATPILMALKEEFDSVDIDIDTSFTTPGGGTQIV